MKIKEGRKLGDVLTAVDQLLASEQPPPKGYLDQWPGSLPFALGNLGTTKKLTVGIDLEPGTCVLAVFDTDADQISKNPKEQITITVA